MSLTVPPTAAMMSVLPDTPPYPLVPTLKPLLTKPLQKADFIPRFCALLFRITLQSYICTQNHTEQKPNINIEIYFYDIYGVEHNAYYPE